MKLKSHAGALIKPLIEARTDRFGDVVHANAINPHDQQTDSGYPENAKP